jgi:hypothetical protein
MDRDRWEALIKAATRRGFSLRQSDPLAFANRTRVLLLKHERSGVDIRLMASGIDIVAKDLIAFQLSLKACFTNRCCSIW